VIAWFGGPSHLMGRIRGGGVALRLILQHPAPGRSLSLLEPIASSVLTHRETVAATLEPHLESA